MIPSKILNYHPELQKEHSNEMAPNDALLNPQVSGSQPSCTDAFSYTK